MEQSRTCIDCAQIKSISDFVVDKSKKTGYKSLCLLCNRIRSGYKGDMNDPRKLNVPRGQGRGKAVTSKEWALRNPERRIELNRKSRAKPEQRAKRKEDARLYKLRKPDAYQNWINKNPDKAMARWTRRRNHFQNANLFYVSKQEIAKLYSLPCFYCGALENIQIDHVMPISRGGKHSIGNLVAACRSCNASKHNKIIMEWRVKHGGFKKVQ